jgi:hypothetical protein
VHLHVHFCAFRQRKRVLEFDRLPFHNAFVAHEGSPLSAVIRSKNLCGLTVIVLEQSAQPSATLNRAFARVALPGKREEQDISLALMVSLGVIMRLILLQNVPQRSFPE